MLDTSARLLRLLALLQARRYWPGAELAARLEVTGRTLRRDVNRLRDLGYTIGSSTGAAGGYQLGRGASLPPLLLEDEEAMAVGISLRTACASGVSGLEGAGLNALAKFEHVLPERLRRRLNALQSSVSPMIGWRPAVEARHGGGL
jgi:predicted DNA-binding transcriptional regulator YafY